MENDRADEILNRIDALERKLDSLSQRVQQLERSPEIRASHAGPVPPVVTQLQQRRAQFAEPQQRPPYTPPPMNTVSTAAQQPFTPPAKKTDTEYLIGAKIIPKAGAALVILGLAFLVILAYRNGFITPWMMYWIEFAFCGAFVFTGILKHDLKEEFGQILTGVGSCGWYLVFAGGHLYYHLYKGEVLIALFFILSLANLAYSFWRSSRSFLVLGLIGGLVTASVLPNLQSDHSVLNAWIHFLILVPAALIIAKNKWMQMAIGLWTAATIALIPILINSLPWFDKVAILYASSAICLAAHGWSYKESDFDKWNVFPPALMWISGMIGLSLNHTQQGAWQYAGFAALFLILGAAFRNKSAVRNAFWIAAIGVPITLAPYCFPASQTVEIFASISILAAILSWKLIPKVAAAAATLEFALAAITYMAGDLNALPWKVETTMLLLLITSVVATSRALVHAYGNSELFSLGAIAFAIPMFGRLSTVILGLSPFHQRMEFAIVLTFLAFAYFTLGVYLRTRWKSALAGFWLLYVVALLTYIAAAAWLDTPLDTSVIVALMLAPILSTTITPDNIREASRSWAAAFVGLLWTRLVVVLAGVLWHLPIEQGTVIGAVIFAMVCFIVTWLNRKRELLYAGWLLLIVAMFAYANMPTHPITTNFYYMTPLMACIVLGGRASAPISPSRESFAVLISLVGWAAFTRWAWLGLALAIPSLNSSPAVTIAWTAYFFGLIALGFAYRIVQFRYVAFFVLAATVGKILIIDLATTDAMIRVAVTIVAGLVMLAASGYWYVRAKEHAPSALSDQ